MVRYGDDGVLRIYAEESRVSSGIENPAELAEKAAGCGERGVIRGSRYAFVPCATHTGNLIYARSPPVGTGG